MQKIAVITGAGTGIGRALTHELAKTYKQQVLAIGRRLEPLQETQIYYPERIKILSADVSREADRKKIVETIPEGMSVRFLVHNAAVLSPVHSISNIKLNDWRSHFAINVEGPLFLTQQLLPKLHGGRIMHISSGAAHHSYAGWAAYCASKAALYQIYEVLKQEMKDKNIAVGSVRPGVVNTPMQDELRQSSPEEFPALPKFIDYKENQKLEDPNTVARFLAWLLCKTDAVKYQEKEWDIREQPADAPWRV